ncbi:unnamed protein product [Laminaria digitata]
MKCVAWKAHTLLPGRDRNARFGYASGRGDVVAPCASAVAGLGPECPFCIDDRYASSRAGCYSAVCQVLLPGRDQNTRFVPTIVMRRAGGGCCSAFAPGFSTMKKKDSPNSSWAEESFV